MPNPNRDRNDQSIANSFFGLASENRLVDTGQSSVQGYGRYQDLLDANPYRNLTYNQSGWQKFLGSLGFRTKYDDFIEQAQINANEYDASVASLMQQNEFNSPSAEAQRMRDAGLNPDLQGIGDVAESASPAEDPNGMNLSATDEGSNLKLVASVGSTLMDIIPGIMSFATNLSQLKGVRLENDAKELAFGNSAIDSATKFFSEQITPEMYRDAFAKGDFGEILNASQKDSDYLSSLLLSSPRARKKYKLLYGQHSRSLAAKMQAYQSYEEFEKHRGEILKTRSSQFFNDDDSVQMELIQSILGPYERYQKRINEINEKIANLRSPELEQGLVNTQLSNQQLYENEIDPVAQASAENAANTAQEQQNEIMTATNELFAEIMKNLQVSDSWWSKIGMALIGIARAQLLSGMSIQFGRSHHVGQTPQGQLDVTNTSMNFAQ